MNIEVIDLQSIGATERTLLQAGTALTSSFDEILFEGRTLGLLFTADIETDLDARSVNFITTLIKASDIVGLNKTQAGIGDALISLFGDASVDNGFLETVFDIASLSTAEELAFALDELGPDGLTPGVRMLIKTQDRFNDLVLGHAGDGDGSHAWSVVDVLSIEQDGNRYSSNFDGDSTLTAFGISNLGFGQFDLSAAMGY